jgi:CheY-like chemotaxis protein
LLTILAVGEDFELLKTRANVLRKTGANVLCASGATALKFLAEWEFDLVVLGHSVRQEDAKRIEKAAHQMGSKTFVLLLVSDMVGEQEYEGINFDGRSLVQPDCLVRSASELLEQQERRRSAEVTPEKQIISPLARKKPSSHPAEIAARKALITHFTNRKAG